MKSPLTDEFMWNLYSAINKTDNVLGMLLFPPRTIHQMAVRLDDLFLRGENYKNRAQFQKLIHHLKKRGWIRIKDLEGKKTVMITKEGMKKTLKASFVIEGKAKRKDGKWIWLFSICPQNIERPGI